MRDLEYTEKEHKELNPYVNPNTTLTAKMAFEREYGSDVAKFFKRKAETPIQLPWLGKRNETIMQSMARQNPSLRRVVDRSGEVLREWAAQELSEREVKLAEAQSQREIAHELLQSKIKSMEAALETKT